MSTGLQIKMWHTIGFGGLTFLFSFTTKMWSGYHSGVFAAAQTIRALRRVSRSACDLGGPKSVSVPGSIGVKPDTRELVEMTLCILLATSSDNMGKTHQKFA